MTLNNRNSNRDIDIYYKKYLIYKKKYIKLKKQKGGDLFELLFMDLINYCIEFNSIETEFGQLFGENRYVHIKGGSSIKYHMWKNNISNGDITSDLDLFLVTSQEEMEFNVQNFYEGLKAILPGRNIQMNNSNGLITFSIDGITMIDMTIYVEPFEDPDPETSMFYTALIKMGYKNYKEYFDSFYSTEDMKTKLEVQTFTSLEFEMYACEKGLEIQNGYLSNSVNWVSYAQTFKARAANTNLSPAEREQSKRMYERYLYQSQPAYIEKIINKRDRYYYKLTKIREMLGLQ